MSTPRERFNAELTELLNKYDLVSASGGWYGMTEIVHDLTQDWEIGIARDRKAKWRVYLPREPKA